MFQFTNNRFNRVENNFFSIKNETNVLSDFENNSNKHIRLIGEIKAAPIILIKNTMFNHNKEALTSACVTKDEIKLIQRPH